MAIKTVLCYTSEDKRMVKKLKNHLSWLEQNNVIDIWDDGYINPGAEWEQEMKNHLDEAQIILLLISADFMASHYHYKMTIQRAIERHEQKSTRVIPVILRSTYWGAPLDKLQPLPNNGRALSEWQPRDKGYRNVVDGLVRVVEQWNTRDLPGASTEREIFVVQFHQLIEAVRVQIQPPARANAIAGTLQELSIFVPNGVTLADLAMGWRAVSQSSRSEEEVAIARRRTTCGELAELATLITREPGKPDNAARTWQIWSDAFKNSDNARQTAMADTFARELSELLKIVRSV